MDSRLVYGTILKGKESAMAALEGNMPHDLKHRMLF